MGASFPGFCAMMEYKQTENLSAGVSRLLIALMSRLTK